MANVSGTDINLTPTEGMKSAARKYKKWKEEGRKGGTQVAAVRATQIISGKELSADVVVRMFSFFSHSFFVSSRFKLDRFKLVSLKPCFCFRGRIFGKSEPN